MLLDCKDLSPGQLQQWLQHAVAPRPIALASTVSKDGQPNLAPFSFFNLFSASPPVVIFSPARRVRDNTTKHTLNNLYFVPEVVIHICDHAMVQQMNLASCDYADDVNEFIKAGFTAAPSTRVRPHRVNEAKIAMECVVKEIKPLGKNGGAGNLVIAEVLCLHVDECILNSEHSMIDPLRIEYIARLGGDFYTSVHRQNVFTLSKPQGEAIGIDRLPASIKNSTVLTGNHLGMLASVTTMPGKNQLSTGEYTHQRAARLLDLGLIDEAWQILNHCNDATLQPAG